MPEAPKVNNISGKLKSMIDEKLETLPSLIQFSTTRNASFTFIDTDNKESMKQQPISTSFFYKAEIIDPGTKQKVTIGVTTSLHVGKNEWSYDFQMVDPTKDAGILSLNKEHDDEKIRFLLISPWVKGSLLESNDTRVEKHLMLIDNASDAKTKNRKRKLKLIVGNLVAGMSDKELKDFAASINIAEPNPEILREQIAAIADNDPDEFNKLFESPTRGVKTTLRNAISQGIVTVGQDNSLTLAKTGVKLVTLQMTEGKDILDRYEQYYLSTTQGLGTHQTIMKAMADDLGTQGNDDETDHKEKKGAGRPPKQP